MSISLVKLVTFQLGVDRFAADVFSVERVLRYTPPSAVPDMPPWIAGVADYRGAPIPVVDLRRRIGVITDQVTPATRIIVLSTSDGWVGAIVDAVHEVATVGEADIAPPPPLFRGLASEFVRGITHVRDQLVVVLDVDRVLSSTARIAFDATPSDTTRGVDVNGPSAAAGARG